MTDSEPTRPEWAVRIISDLRSVSDKMTEMVDMTKENQRTLRGFNGNKGLCQRVGELESSMDELKGLIDEVRVDVKQHMEESKSGAASHEEFRYLSWQWLIDKIGAPVLVAVIGFTLFTICPTIYVAVYIIPKLMSSFKITP